MENKNPFSFLQKEILALGKTRIHSFHAWTVIVFSVVITWSLAQISIGNVQGSITVLTPNGGEVWERKSVQSVTWSASGVSEVRIELVRDGSVVRRIARSTDAGVGFYNWTVPKGQRTDDTYTVRISDLNGVAFDESEGTFSVVDIGVSDGGSADGTDGSTDSGGADIPSESATTSAAITVLSPNGGELWPRNSTQAVSWSALGIEEVRIELMNEGSVIRRIARNVSGDSSPYTWNVPKGQQLRDTYTVRVRDLNSDLHDESDSVFSIVEEGAVAPDTGGGGVEDKEPSQVVAPTIVPEGGTFVNSVTVVLETSTAGADIFYTTDFSEPTKSATLYTGPFSVDSSLMVKAKAFTGSGESAVASAVFTKAGSGDGDTLTLITSKDSTLKKPHRDNNTGIIEHLLVKKGGGINRGIVGFNLLGLPEGGIQSATLVLHVYSISNMGSGGKNINAYRVLEDWTEGNARYDRFKDQPPVQGSGTGVTWSCGIDLDISNGQTDCESPWEGGNFDAVPTDKSLHLDDTAVASWNVTADVLEALSTGDTEISWVLKKNDEVQEKGGVFYYSKEGADYFNDQNLAPKLILEF